MLTKHVVRKLRVCITVAFCLLTGAGCVAGINSQSSGSRSGESLSLRSSIEDSGMIDISTLDGATGVPIDSSFAYDFPINVDSQTVGAAAFFILQRPQASISRAAVDTDVCNMAGALAAAIEWPVAASRVMTTPAEYLGEGLGYTICLTPDIEYDNGEHFGGLMASFTTAENTSGATGEGVPVILSIEDASGQTINQGASGIDLSWIVLTFDRAMNAATVSAENITLVCGGLSPSIAFEGMSDAAYRITVASASTYRLMSCTLTLTTGVKSAVGTSLATTAYQFTAKAYETPQEVDTCGAGLTATDADGTVYDTVEIGSQCWMAKNLGVGTKIGISDNQTQNGVIEKHCYDDDSANCATDGGLYQWDEATQYSSTEGVRGICPAGWHIPTDAEWYTLESGLWTTGSCSSGSTSWRCQPAGTALKSGGASGFEGVLTGWCESGSCSNHGGRTYLWSSSEHSSSRGWARSLCSTPTCASSVMTKTGRFGNTKTGSYSVRCIRD